MLIHIREYQRGNTHVQPGKTGKTRNTRQRKTKQKHNTICVGYHYTQLSINSASKTCGPAKNWR